MGLVIVLLLPLIFPNEIADLFATDRDDLTPLVSLETHHSNWELHQCINEIRVSGLGFQSRRGPYEFIWTGPDGITRNVDSYTNASRDTRLDIVDFGNHRLVQFYNLKGSTMREGERRHLAECLGVTQLPAK